MDLIPHKATFAPGEPVTLECIDAIGPLTVQVSCLDRVVHTADAVDGSGVVRLPPCPVGGYGISASDATGQRARTAFDVLESPLDRPRYGFVADFALGHDAADLVRTARELHLNLIQFYDWAQRYASLVPECTQYTDPLGRQLSLHTVRAMTAGLRQAGSLPLGYAAVYAVGGADWAQWSDAALLDADGQPHRFTDDLLRIVDPANPRWVAHFISDLRQATDRVGFRGFHLDSYGWPKRAFRTDGSICDLTEAFPALLSAVHRALPESTLVFNNVNDFPTWTTAATPDTTYIEVWPPHTTLAHLGALALRARSMNPGRAPILAAYLPFYATATPAHSDAGAKLVMATIFSHGATHLLLGEDGRVLTDPYYPNNHLPGTATRAMMRRWYDFLVRAGDLLLAPDAVDVTRSYTGGINEDLRVDGPPGLRISTDAQPGTVWVRVTAIDAGLILHLINLTDQVDTDWATPKAPATPVHGLRLSVLRSLGTARPVIADPDSDDITPTAVNEPDGRYETSALPPLTTWSVVFLAYPTQKSTRP